MTGWTKDTETSPEDPALAELRRAAPDPNPPGSLSVQRAVGREVAMLIGVSVAVTVAVVGMAGIAYFALR
jgi:hypothetical protein